MKLKALVKLAAAQDGWIRSDLVHKSIRRRSTRACRCCC